MAWKGISATVKEFIVRRMLVKGAKAAAVTFAASKVPELLAQYGVSVTLDADAVAAGVVGLAAMALNWWKNRGAK